MRQAQAVLLPLELGLSLEQTGNMRTRFMAVSEGRRAAPRSKRELRNRASARLEREAKILDEVLRGAADGAVLDLPQLKPKTEARLGKPLALCSGYRRLARHGWRKLAPDTRHPDGDPQAREDLRVGLCEKHFHNRVFDSLDAVEDHLVASLHGFDLDQSRIHSITAWQ